MDTGKQGRTAADFISGGIDREIDERDILRVQDRDHGGVRQGIRVWERYFTLTDIEPGRSSRAQKDRETGQWIWQKNAEDNATRLLAIVQSADDAIIGKTIRGIVQTWNRIARGERVDHFDTVRRRKDGRLINVSVAISPIRDRSGSVTGASHFARAITAGAELQLARARLAAIVESSDDAIVSKNLMGVVQTWNKGAERVYGYSTVEMIGRPMSMLLPPDRPVPVSVLRSRAQ
jgi:PAS domain-containing protein